MVDPELYAIAGDKIFHAAVALPITIRNVILYAQ
jgi:hypothetical protein